MSVIYTQLATQLGATHTINYKTHPDWDKGVIEVGTSTYHISLTRFPLCSQKLLYSHSWRAQLTNNFGAHHIFDTVGINDLERTFACIAPGGVINSIGILGGPPSANPNVPLLALLKGAYLRCAVAFMSFPFAHKSSPWSTALEHHSSMHPNFSIHFGNGGFRVAVNPTSFVKRYSRRLETNPRRSPPFR